MWAVGCILAELLGRKPLFPGKDYVDMLKMIVAKIGNPPIEDQVIAQQLMVFWNRSRRLRLAIRLTREWMQGHVSEKAKKFLEGPCERP